MALRGGGADEVLRSELRHDAIDVLGAVAVDDFLGHLATGPGENAFDSCGITNQHDCVSGHRGLGAIVQFEHCGFGRERRFELKSGEVRFRRNAIEFGAQTLRFSGEVNFVGQNVGGGALIEEFLQIVVFPPRFDDVVIGNDFAFAFDDEAGTEDVNLKMRSLVPPSSSVTMPLASTSGLPAESTAT